MKKSSPKKWVLLNPGPVNVTARVRQSLLGPDLCHRELEFERLLQSVRSKLLNIFGIQKNYVAAILTGSGTIAVETMLTTYGRSGHKILVLSNGVYGERLAEILKSHRLPHTVLKSSPGAFPSIELIEEALKKDIKIKAVAMVHHETSTGMLNPLQAVGLMTKKHHRTFLVDAVSSLGAEGIDFKKCGINFLAGSSGKCLHAYPGVAFVLLSKKEARRLPKNCAGVYTDLSRYLGGEPPFTPAVQLFYALEAALEELRREGLTQRIRSYAQKSALLQEGLAKLGIRFLVSEAVRSHVLTAAWLPDGISYETLHDRLKKEGFVIYAGQSALKGSIFRVSNLGDVSKKDLRRFLNGLTEIIGKRPHAQTPKAVVLAAGSGKRFDARARSLPKCLIPLDKKGNTLFKRYLDSFRAVGLKKVVIVVGHQKEKIKSACKRWGRGLRVRFIENPGYRRGSILSLFRASTELGGPVLVMDADVFFPTEALRRLLDCESSSAFLIDPRVSSAGEEMMLQAKRGRPWHLSKPLVPGLSVLGEATGIVRFDASVAKQLRVILREFYKRDDLDREYEDVYCVLLKRNRVGYATMEGLDWSEIDFEEDLKKVSRFLN